MFRNIILFTLFTSSIFGQWTKVYTGPTSGSVGPFFNGYHDIHYDAFTGRVYIDSTDLATDATQIYSARLSSFDPTNGAAGLTKISANGQANGTGCLTAVDAPNGLDTFPPTYHPVGQIWIDTKRHRLYSMAGTAGSYITPDLYYYQLINPPDNHQNWVHVAPIANYPLANGGIVATTLSASLTSGATTMTLTTPGTYVNGSYVKVDTEIIRIIGGGGRRCASGPLGTNPFTIARGQMGTIAASRLSAATVQTREGIFNGATAVYDPLHDVTIILGLPVNAGLGNALYAFCVTSDNPTPGTLTAGQITGGCNQTNHTVTHPDDFTNLSALAICTDVACVTTTGVNADHHGVPPTHYYPNGEWDSINNRIIYFGGMQGATTIINQMWFYAPATKTFTPRTAGLANIGANTPTPSGSAVAFTATTCTNSVVTFDASVSNNLACNLSPVDVVNSSITNGTINQILNIKLCQGSTIRGFSWPPNLINPPYVPTSTTSGVNCTLFAARYDGTNWNNLNPPIQSSNGEGARVAHVFNPNDGKLYYHRMSRTGVTPLPSVNTPETWAYNVATDTWARISAGSGPTYGETMTITGNNSLVLFASTNQGNGPVEMWTNQLTPSVLNVPLTISESLYPGSTSGVNRINEPFCQGVPIADSANIIGTGGLGLTGASAGQFRALGTWPSGHTKWVEVCGIIPSISAGGTATVTLTASGSGNFGGSDMATDNSPDANHITVNTGTGSGAAFSIKKANFNLIDQALIDASTIVASSVAATRGLVITGPVSPATTCGTCTTVYSSANDPNSTTTIEKNGPVEVVLRTVFTYKDAGGNPYMQGTVRMKFHKNRNDVRITVVRRNANYDTSAIPSPDFAGSTFNTAYKGFQSDEIRLDTAISSPQTWTIANDTATPTTGTLTVGTDTAHLYQAQSTTMLAASAGGSQDYTNNANTGSNGSCALGSACAATFTPDSGFTIIDQTGTRASGNSGQHPQGWCDIRNASGGGVEVGIYQMSAYWPKSCDFLNGGTDMRIGLRPQWNSVASYQAWPAWDINPDVWLQFHIVTPSNTTMANDFLAFQHPLVARATPAYYNSTTVFAPHTLIDSATETAYYRGLQVSSSPSIPLNRFLYQCPSGCTAIGPDLVVPDRGTNIVGFNIIVPRWYYYPVGGAGNQEEFRWADDMRFLQGGQTGRFIASNQFYRWQAGNAWPHSDGVTSADATVNGFQWQNRPQAFQASPELDLSGFPSMTSGCQFNAPPMTISGTCATKITNYNKSFVAWPTDWLHKHVYGITDHYFLTGDETLREAIYAFKSQMLNPQTYQQGEQGGSVQPGENCGGSAFCNTRAQGIFIMSAARFGSALASTGDSDAANVTAAGKYVFDHFIKPDVCVPGPGGVGSLPIGCTLPPATTYATVDPQGISRVRGIHLSARNPGWCPKDIGSNSYRIAQVFQHSILGKGLREFRQAKGTSWTDYALSGDLNASLGVSVRNEMFNWDGTNNWQSATANGLYNGTRFIMVSDIQNQCTVPLNQVDTSGYVTTNGFNVIWNSGQKFDNVAATDLIGINGTQLVVGSVTDNQHLTLSGNPAGVNTTPVPWVRGGQQPLVPGSKAGNGLVSVSGGVNVTLLSGPNFDVAWVGSRAAFGGGSAPATAVISAVPTATTLTLATSVPNSASVGLAINPGIYQVGSNTYDAGSLAQPNQGMFDVFSIMSEGTGDTSWKPLFDISMQQLAFRFGPVTAADFGTIDIWDDIAAINAGGTSLQDISFNFTDQGSGNYLIGYTPPTGSTSTRVKYSPVAAQVIQGDLTKLLNFNNWTGQTYGINPATSLPWFGANTTIEPAVTPGFAQSFVVNTTTLTGAPITGLTKNNFSVKVLSVPLTLAITTTSLPSTTVGSNYSQTLLATGGTTPYTWTTTPITGAFCAGMSLSSAGVISIPSVSGTSCTFTVRVTDSHAVTATSENLTIVIGAAPVITTTTLPDATYGTLYSTTLAVSGGVSPYTWSLTAGALPNGLSLQNQAGQGVQPNLSSPVGLIRGIPTQVGIYGFTFTITVTDSVGVTGSKVLTMKVNAKFTYGNPSITPTGCTNTNTTFYAAGDLAKCDVSGEVPLGTYSIPAVGASHVDPNFGTTVTVLSHTPSLVSYSTPAALSATGLYAAIAQNGAATIINAATGAVVRASAPGNITGTKVLNWDKTDNDKYYGIGAGNSLNMYKVSDGSTTQLIANLATSIGCTSVQTGGTSDLSNDNWFPFYSDGTCHKAGIVKLSNLHVYSFDYRTPHNGVTPADMDSAGGYVISSKGVDSVTGKRYIIAATNPFVFGYIINDPNDGVINYERLGPERPHNAYIFTGGTDNNICETGERCLNDPHGDTMQDTDGQQYYMVQQDQKVSGLEFRTLSYFRINAGDLMMRSSANEGGGRTDIWGMFKTPDGWLEGHEGCAKTAVCVISTHSPNRTAGDLTSSYTHQAHQGNIWAIQGVGREIRALAYSQSINWTGINATIASTSCNGAVCTFITAVPTALVDLNDNTCISGTGITEVDVSTNSQGRCWTSHKVNSTTFTINIATTGTSSVGTLGVAPQYWGHPFASISGDGSRVIWNSNFGYYDIDGKENVETALTGLSAASLAITTAPLASGTVSSSYSQNLASQVTGGVPPYTYTVATGALPTSLTLSSDGIISGTPSAAATFTFTIMVTDSVSVSALSGTETIVINALVVPPSITSTIPVTGTIGVPYSTTLTGVDGTLPYTWSISVGVLPLGLNLAPSTGVITGTPSTAGVYNFTVKLTDAAAATTTHAYTITISPPAPSITSALGTSGTVGIAYTGQLTGTGGTPPYTWAVTVGTLPTSLSLNASTGAITGSPTVAGVYSFTIRLTDNAAVTATRAYTITVLDAPPPPPTDGTTVIKGVIECKGCRETK